MRNVAFIHRCPHGPRVLILPGFEWPIVNLMFFCDVENPEPPQPFGVYIYIYYMHTLVIKSTRHVKVQRTCCKCKVAFFDSIEGLLFWKKSNQTVQWVLNYKWQRLMHTSIWDGPGKTDGVAAKPQTQVPPSSVAGGCLETLRSDATSIHRMRRSMGTR